ncbi:Hypothetical predicted protein [Marmota monax]|uniref:Uncharacterized protein n=1 Tax=Marmota monax TaxID=9995 RepID=A0A5E4BIL5_MARMO|nr:Hypothetical predicted protein [Marmota monax]
MDTPEEAFLPPCTNRDYGKDLTVLVRLGPGTWVPWAQRWERVALRARIWERWEPGQGPSRSHQGSHPTGQAVGIQGPGLARCSEQHALPQAGPELVVEQGEVTQLCCPAQLQRLDEYWKKARTLLA